MNEAEVVDAVIYICYCIYDVIYFISEEIL